MVMQGSSVAPVRYRYAFCCCAVPERALDARNSTSSLARCKHKIRPPFYAYIIKSINSIVFTRMHV